MVDEPVVQNSILDIDMHLAFLISLRDGNPQYDPPMPSKLWLLILLNQCRGITNN